METYTELANLIFKNIKDANFYEEKYPKRELEKGAYVTRFAPSPTGFVHIGGLYTAMVSKKLADQTNGVSLLRIEDTDQERKIEGATEEIIEEFQDFDIIFNEGPTVTGKEIGEYGPYVQSERKDIYHSFAKHLISQGKAYPCFISKEELDQIREDQLNSKKRPGVYGMWAKYRDLDPKKAIEKINAGEEYVIRLKSPGDPDKKIILKDKIKGKIEFPENDQDIVIIKSDGLPTYHFAHAVDDHLMRVNLITRSDEWLPSAPLHLQLFDVLEFERPEYAHIAPLMKIDEETNAKRKLSKRKDPESAVSYYKQVGIPSDSVKEYLLNIANSNFEIWRKQNKTVPLTDFKLEINKMGVSGALFDLVKLLDVSKDVISKYTVDEIYTKTIEWAKKFNEELFEILNRDEEYSKLILNIERETGKRKDIAKYSDVLNEVSYFYEDLFKKEFSNFEDYEFQKINNKEEIVKILEDYIQNYLDLNDEKTEWFNKLKDLSEKHGYAREVKEFKTDPEKYLGHVGDISTILRVAVTGRSKTPELFEILKVLGKEKIIARIRYLSNL